MKEKSEGVEKQQQDKKGKTGEREVDRQSNRKRVKERERTSE